ncbi:polysaccharide biosynthesis protein [Actinomycetota bacterium]
MKVRIKKYTKQIALVLADIAFVYLAIYIGLLLRLELTIPVHLLEMTVIHGIFISAIFIILFFLFGLYNSLWEYAGSKEVFKISGACIIGMIIVVIIEFLLPNRLPLGGLAAAGLVLILLVGGMRMTYRVLRRILKKRYSIFPNKNSPGRRVMIIGAGDAASIIIREMLFNPESSRIPVVAVDDDRKKHGKSINGIRIESDCNRIPDLIKKYNIQMIVFAIPTASRNRRRKILKICSETGCILKMMPSVSDLHDYDNLNSIIRDVKIEDLLGRNEVKLDAESITGYLKDKTVLITGGGGSIGSEIARQVIKFDPKKLVILDIYENNAYRLLHELRIKYGRKVPVDLVIASIRDIDRLKDIFLQYKPDVVFHSAAHKHVPLMEACPCEAIKNNVLGTFNTAQMASDCNVKQFVLISTDKAVNPTNIMGATKKVAEMIVQSMNRHSDTEFVAVRFGNVLGSNGSVIPLFKKQIESGGPVTVTHPNIKRYFMTITEAAQLVIQTGAIAKGGEIFVLNMGKLIKIMDLAENLIRLSGLIPDEDIKIEITGLRPGEKMFEELMLDEEGVDKTSHKKIFIGRSHEVTYKDTLYNIKLLVNNMSDPVKLREAMKKVVPTYNYKKESVKRVDDLEKQVVSS